LKGSWNLGPERRKTGARIILDIDYRPVLWGLTSPGLGEERFVADRGVSAHLQTIVPDCDLVVGTEEEIHIAGGSTDTMTALRRLRELTQGLLVVKRGPMGCAMFPGPIPATTRRSPSCRHASAARRRCARSRP